MCIVAYSYIPQHEGGSVVLRLHSSLIVALLYYRSHEWCKHGTCAVAANITSDEQTYFAKALSLFQNYDIGKTLSDAGIKPSNNTAYSVRGIFEDYSKVKSTFSF